MTEAEYRALTQVCDEILMEPDATVERVAIPWLHVLREHPYLLVQYSGLFAPTESESMAPAPWSWRKTLRPLRYGLNWIRNYRLFRSSGGWMPAKLPRDVDILIVSHLLSPGQAGESRDFYYGDVPNQLVREGLRILVVLLNQTNRPSVEFAERWGAAAVPRVVLPLGGYQRSSHRRRLSREARRLGSQAERTDDDLKRRVMRRAAVEVLGASTRAVLGIAESIGALVAATRAKSLVTTFEGHAWERVVYSAARRVRPSIRCLGFHQACLFPLQHAIKRSLRAEFNPDRILTVGPVTCAELAAAPGLVGIPVSIFGSDRGLEDDNQEPLAVWRRSYAEMLSHPTCIVLPEGLTTECAILFDFALNIARLLPDVKFIWRLHPNLPLASVVEVFPHFRELPENISVSENPLEADLAASRWALYRGTTAIFRAVLAGLRPLYLARSDELSIDSLYSLRDWKRQVTDPVDFLRIVAADRSGSPGLDSEFECAFSYCANYFQRFDSRVLAEAALGSSISS